MKNLSFGLVAFICVQVIHAINNNCESDLSNLRSEAADFFAIFEAEHGLAHQDLEVIQDSTFSLGKSLDDFASTIYDYGDDVSINTLQCVVIQFVDTVSVRLPETEESIKSLKDRCDSLLMLALKFKFSHNLICMSGKYTGCEAELNTLRCELSQFIRGLKKAAVQANTDLRRIASGSSSLSSTERSFKSKYQLTCGQGVVNENKLRDDVKMYYKQIRRPYDDASVRLDDLSAICDNLTLALSEWNTKLA